MCGFLDDDEPQSPAEDEASYCCGACGEEIVVPVDPSSGRQQQYVEDCPVCCRPNVLSVEWLSPTDIRIRSELE